VSDAGGREKMLDVFGIGPEDLEASRAGRLGPGQARRLLKSGRSDVIAAIIAGVVLAAILAFIAHKPLKPAQVITALVLFGVALAFGLGHFRKMRAAVADGRVETLSGPVRVFSRGKQGWHLTVADRTFRLPVRPWNVGNEARYRVYVSTAAQQIVGMEPE